MTPGLSVFVSVAMLVMVMAAAGMTVRVTVLAIIVPVIVAMVMMVVTALAVIVRILLRLEGTAHRARRAAAAAHEFGRALGHVEHLRTDLGGDMVATELPGEPHQTRRVPGPNLQKILLGGAHADQAAVIQLERVAILEHGPVGQRERDDFSGGGRDRGRMFRAGRVVERERIDDLVGPDCGLADDLEGFRHGKPRMPGKTGAPCNTTRQIACPAKFFTPARALPQS